MSYNYTFGDLHTLGLFEEVLKLFRFMTAFYGCVIQLRFGNLESNKTLRILHMYGSTNNI